MLLANSATAAVPATNATPSTTSTTVAIKLLCHLCRGAITRLASSVLYQIILDPLRKMQRRRHAYAPPR
jgi:hypothetical protein